MCRPYALDLGFFKQIGGGKATLKKTRLTRHAEILRLGHSPSLRVTELKLGCVMGFGQPALSPTVKSGL